MLESYLIFDKNSFLNFFGEKNLLLCKALEEKAFLVFLLK